MMCGRSRSDTRMNGVVPLWTDIMHLEVQCRHHLVWDLHPFGIDRGHQMRLDTQPRRRPRLPNVLHHHLERPQRTPRPCLADLAEQPMLDRIPFRRACRVVTHRDTQPEAIGHLHLQPLLPHSRPRTIAAATIRFDQQSRGSWKALLHLTRTLLRNSVHSKGCRVRRLPNVDRPAIVLPIIDPVWHGSTNGILRKIMRIDHLSLLTPDLASVLEVPNQLFLLGVDADHRLVGRLMHRSLSQDLLKLLVSLRMLLTRRLFDVGAQAVALLTEQAANNWLADKMTSLVQLSANVA